MSEIDILQRTMFLSIECERYNRHMERAQARRSSLLGESKAFPNKVVFYNVPSD